MSTAFKNRLKTYSFWVSLASAVLLLVQTIGRPLGLMIDEALYMSVVNSVLGVFVVLGIISHPSQSLLNTNNENEPKEQTENNTVSVQNDCILGGVTEDTKSGGNVGKINTNVNEDNIVTTEKISVEARRAEIRENLLNMKK